MSAECHCRETAQNQGGGGVGSSEWRRGVRDKENQGESGQRTAPGASTVAASNWSTSQPRRTQPLPPFHLSLSLSKLWLQVQTRPRPPPPTLWQRWRRRLWRWPLSWTPLPRRRAHTLQCARPPADLGEVSQNLLTWLVSPSWHAGPSERTPQRCTSLSLSLSLPSQPCQRSRSSQPDKILSDTNFNYSPHPNNAMWQELSLL